MKKAGIGFVLLVSMVLVFQNCSQPHFDAIQSAQQASISPTASNPPAEVLPPQPPPSSTVPPAQVYPCNSANYRYQSYNAPTAPSTGGFYLLSTYVGAGPGETVNNVNVVITEGTTPVKLWIENYDKTNWNITGATSRVVSIQYSSYEGGSVRMGNQLVPNNLDLLWDFYNSISFASNGTLHQDSEPFYVGNNFTREGYEGISGGRFTAFDISKFISRYDGLTKIRAHYCTNSFYVE